MEDLHHWMNRFFDDLIKEARKDGVSDEQLLEKFKSRLGKDAAS